MSSSIVARQLARAWAACPWGARRRGASATSAWLRPHPWLEGSGYGTGRPKGGPFATMFRQRPTLPPSRPGSTIGAGGLNFRVRDGTGCFPSAMATETRCLAIDVGTDDGEGAALEQSSRTTIASASKKESSPRAISTGQLHTLPCFHFPPINLVVFEGPYLVTQWETSSLRRASHLDAFSAYPFRTWPTSHAAGATTGTPEVRPPRSSRTRGSSSSSLLRPQRIGTELSHDVLNPARVPL